MTAPLFANAGATSREVGQNLDSYRYELSVGSLQLAWGPVMDSNPHSKRPETSCSDHTYILNRLPRDAVGGASTIQLGSCSSTSSSSGSPPGSLPSDRSSSAATHDGSPVSPKSTSLAASLITAEHWASLTHPSPSSSSRAEPSSGTDGAAAGATGLMYSDPGLSNIWCDEHIEPVRRVYSPETPESWVSACTACERRGPATGIEL